MESVLSPPEVLHVALRTARELGVEFDTAFTAGVQESVRTIPAELESGLWQTALSRTRDAWQRAYDGVAPEGRDVAVTKAAIMLGIDSGASAPGSPLGRSEQRAVARTLQRCGIPLDAIAFAVGVRDDRAAWSLIADSGRLADEYTVRKVRTPRLRGDDRREAKILAMAGVA